MRAPHLIVAAALWLLALPVMAHGDADRLLQAMGAADQIAAFAEDGMQSAAALDSDFLGGQGGDVFAETVRRLHAPERLTDTLTAAFGAAIAPRAAQQALVFFGSEMGQRITEIEVEARRAMISDDTEAAVRGAAPRAGPEVQALISARDLVERNIDIAIAAQQAFWDGLASTAPGTPTPDIEGQRGVIGEGTRDWVTGYYMLVASALAPEDLATYTAFWRTSAGQALDDALEAAYTKVYAELSYALGQAVGRLMPMNEL